MAEAWQVLHEEFLMNLIFTADARSAKCTVHRHAQRIHGYNDLKRCDGLDALISTVPVINKAALQDRLKNENWLIKSLLYSETSGTTGMPLPTPRGKEDLHWNAMNQAYAYRRFLNPGDDRVAILHPSILSPFVEASAMALQMLNTGYVRIYPIPEICDHSRLYDVMDRYAVTTIMSTPSLVYKLLYEFMNRQGGIPCSLKKLLLTGEPLGAASKENLQKIIGVDNKTLIAPFVYGSSEIATVMYGKRDGSFEPILDDFVFEFHENTDFPGSYRLILTWLREGVMPILRYDTNDYFMFNGDVESPSLRFLGRGPLETEVHEVEEKIEQTIYSLDEPVFHFECRYSMREKEASVNVVVMGRRKEVCAELESQLNGLLEGWKIKTGLLETENGFFGLSPKTKIQKFKRI